VVSTLNEAQAWLVVLIFLAVMGGVVIVLALAGGLRARSASGTGRMAADEAQRRELAELGARLAALEQGVARVVDALPRSIQGVGVVRYNPFSDMGGNMSFSLALLDGRASGVVVSVLTNRDGSRVYGKAVENGTSSYPLSDEERQALALAQGQRT